MLLFVSNKYPDAYTHTISLGPFHVGFYYLYGPIQTVITNFWCWCAIIVIFKHKYVNFRVMFVSALFISILSSAVLVLLVPYDSNGDIRDEYKVQIRTTIWNDDLWRYDRIYSYILKFPFEYL